MKKLLKNKLFITGLFIVIVIVGTYSWAWYQLYEKSTGFYLQARENYNAGNLIIALKGGRKVCENEQGYTFISGFEQVVSAFSGKFAYPKPSVYYMAQEKIHELIYEKMTAEQGYMIYIEYFKLDNKYLGDVLLRVGEIYMSENKFQEALKAFNTAIESFPYNEKVVGIAKAKITEIKKLYKG